MTTIVITAGDMYTDIDVLASAVAYQELLQIQGQSAKTVLRGPLNKSVTEIIKSWPFVFSKEIDKDIDSNFVIVDMSDPKHFSSFVPIDKIMKIFDHHFGYEKYWNDKLHENAVIENVGACATLIWEEFEKSGLGSKISKVSANTLYTAILSNTLDFKSSVTSERDRNAFQKLSSYIQLPSDWKAMYFEDQDSFAHEHPFQAVKEDSKIVEVRSLGAEMVISQLELWDSRKYFNSHLPGAIKAMQSFGKEFFLLTSPSISEGKNYLYSEDKKVKDLISSKLKVTFENNIATTQGLLLRKEIIRELQS